MFVNSREGAPSLLQSDSGRLVVIELPDDVIRSASPIGESGTGSTAGDDIVDPFLTTIAYLLTMQLEGPSGSGGVLIWRNLSGALVAHVTGSQCGGERLGSIAKRPGCSHAVVVALEDPFITSAFHRVPQSGQLAPWQLRRAEEMLLVDSYRITTITEIARACGLSRGHFSKAFKASTGSTPHRWFARCRMEKAKRDLLHSSKSIAQIAADCGFSDQSHLTRAFQQATGVAPRSWQRMHRR